jgi:uncharacterized membrane protein
MPPASIASHYIILGLLLGFAIAHSGLAALRPWAETKIGARLYRVIFALVSIPFATILIIYFFNHRYDGWQLWQVQGTPWVTPLVWILSLISFLFLYPATFNLLEIAAVFKPQVRIYETGIMRITLWIGTTFSLVTSIGLMLHHLFAVWHGDYRLSQRYGAEFAAVKARTSIVPFAAVLDGRQTLQLSEFLRPAYVGVIVFVMLFWWGHPWLIQTTARVLF